MEDDIDEHLYETEESEDVYSVRRPFGFVDQAAVSAEALNELLNANLPFNVDWKVSQARWTFDLTGVTVTVDNNIAGGLSAQAESDVMSRRRLDPLRAELRRMLSEALRQPEWSCFDFGIMLLQMVEESAWHIQESEKWQAPKKAMRDMQDSGYDASSVQGWAKILDNPRGVDLMSVNDTAKFLLGRSISDILKEVTDGVHLDGQQLRVLHVEPVFRNDLVKRFLQRRQEIESELLDLTREQLRQCVARKDLVEHAVHSSKEGMATHLATPVVTFHGAPRHVVSSIVRYGFLKPGDKIGNSDRTAQMSSGASYGIGVYSSPSFSYASMYGQYTGGQPCVTPTNPADVPGLRIVVCATIMGRPVQVTRDETRRTTKVFAKGAHSHVSPNKLEYVVFDTAQIVPCYVLHLDYGAENSRRHFRELQMNSSLLNKPKLKSRLNAGFSVRTEDSPAAKLAEKQALKAAAAKWFPYGFGPATGTKFVIEEIGYVSDDEEDFGEFQAIRGEQDREVREYEEQRDGEKESWFDEYQTVRRTYQDV